MNFGHENGTAATLINKCKQVDSIAATFIYAQQQATLGQQGLRAELGHWKGPNFKPKQAVTKATNRTVCAKDKQASTTNGRPSHRPKASTL